MKAKILRVTLDSIEYRGDNIGRDLKFSFTNGNRKRIIEMRIPNGHTKSLTSIKNFNNSVVQKPASDNDEQLLSIDFDVLERDIAMNNQGTSTMEKTLDFSSSKSLKLNHVVKVDEGKKKAIFKFELKASLDEIDVVNVDTTSFAKADNRYPLLVAISDVLLAGVEYINTFKDEEKAAIFQLLDMLEKYPGQVELLLLGNFMNLWETPDFFFGNVDNAEKERITSEKVKKIYHFNQIVFNKLKTFTSRPNIVINYVPGSHDEDLKYKSIQDLLMQLTGISFRFSNEFYHKPYKMMAVHGAELDKVNYVETLAYKPSARILAEQFSSTQQELADTERNPIAHVDNFQPLENYKEYCNSLRLNEDPKYILNEEDFEFLREEIIKAPPPSSLGKNAAENIIEALRTEIGNSVFDRFRYYGLVKQSRYKPLTEETIKGLFPRSRTKYGATRCILLGYKQNRNIIFRKQDACFNVAGWRPVTFFDAENPGKQEVIPSAKVTLLFRKPTANSKRKVQLQQYQMPNFQLVENSQYTI